MLPSLLDLSVCGSVVRENKYFNHKALAGDQVLKGRHLLIENIIFGVLKSGETGAGLWF